MKGSIAIIIISLLSSTIYGQKDSIPPIESIQDTVRLDTMAYSEGTLRQLEVQKNIPLEPISLTNTDSISPLRDHKRAAVIDSLWFREMANASLFDSIQKSVETFDMEEEVEYPELTTEVLKERLALLNARTPFNIQYNPSLENVIKHFLKDKREMFGRVLLKSQFYYPMFEEALDRNNIPLEMKHLSVVESALNPRAKSRVGATGLWQFMYATGRMYNLKVSSYVDERSDPLKSTQAACNYLSSLYKVFGDWDLALAAYNSGPGNVSKAIRRSGGYENYWNLRPFLPRETAGYVPAFYATLYIFEYAEEHGFKREQFERPYFVSDTVRVKELITFDQISEVIDIDVEELQFYNPSYKLDIVPYVKGRDHYLRLPKDKVGIFVSHEDSIYAYARAEIAKRERPLPQFFEMDRRVRYKVRSGDYLGRIARRYGVRVSDIKRWNGLRSNNIRVGQRLTIYPKKPYFQPTSKADKKPVADSNGYYIVKRGDSLWEIAQKFPGVSVKNLKEWNNIKGNDIKPGTRLKVSKG